MRSDDSERFARRFPALADTRALLSAFERHEADAGEALVAAGTPSDELFLVSDGELAVVMPGAERALARIETGAMFGEVSLLDPGPATASVVTEEGCTVLRLSRARFDELRRDDEAAAAALLREVIRSLDARLRRASGTLAADATAPSSELGELDEQSLDALLELGGSLARRFRDVTQRVRERVQVGPESAALEYDVVVIGGGPHGLAYAMWLKQDRPETRIAVVEKRARPGFKIGESTLGPVVRAAMSLGIPLPVLRRLFNNKLGLHFWWMDDESSELQMHVDHVIEETFQLERRVYELLYLNVARRAGIDVYQDTRVALADSRIEGQPKELVCERANGDVLRLRCSVVCDASGPAAALGRHLGIRRKNTDFNTNAYFAYFNRTRPTDIPTWDKAATKHLCFPQGWVWFIELASWERAPDERLNAMIDYLLDIGSADEQDYPTRFELAERFDAQLDQWPTSIGVVPRSDIDTAAELPLEERFDHYVNRYPAFRRVMDEYDLIPDPYAGHPTYIAYTDLVQHSERYAGDGWLLVGDAAYFVNPLYSPGMTYGHSVASFGARETASALESGDFSQAAFTAHDEAVRRIYEALVLECEALYRAFRHVDAYEKLFLLRIAFHSSLGAERILRFGGVQALRVVKPVRPMGPTAEAVANPRYVELLRRAVDVMRDLEARGADPAETGKAIAAIVDPVVREIAELEPVQALHVGQSFQYYNDRYERIPGKEPWDSLTPAWICPRCRNFTRVEFAECYVCGEPAPEGAHRPAQAPPVGAAPPGR